MTKCNKRFSALLAGQCHHHQHRRHHHHYSSEYTFILEEQTIIITMVITIVIILIVSSEHLDRASSYDLVLGLVRRSPPSPVGKFFSSR